jgi:hypothetical protein
MAGTSTRATGLTTITESEPGIVPPPPKKGFFTRKILYARQSLKTRKEISQSKRNARSVSNSEAAQRASKIQRSINELLTKNIPNFNDKFKMLKKSYPTWNKNMTPGVRKLKVLLLLKMNNKEFKNEYVRLGYSGRRKLEEKNRNNIVSRYKHLTKKQVNIPAKINNPPPITKVSSENAQSKMTAAKTAVNATATAKQDTLQAIKNYKPEFNKFNVGQAKKLIDAYREAHRGQPDVRNNKAVKDLRRRRTLKIANVERLRRENSNREKFAQKTQKTQNLISISNNAEFIKEYKQLGFVGLRNLKETNRTLVSNRYKKIMAKAALLKSVQNHFSGVSQIYNKAVINAILAHPNIPLTNNQKLELQRAKQTRGRQIAGTIGSGFVTAGGYLVTKGGDAGSKAWAAGGIGNAKTLNRGTRPPSVTNRLLGFFSTKPAAGSGPAPPASSGAAPSASRNLPNFIQLNDWTNWLGRRKPIPLGYLLKTNTKGTGYYKNNSSLQTQLNRTGHGPQPRPTGYYGPRRNYGNYGPRRNYGNYGPRRNYGPNRGGASGGITFAPKINVGAARIGAHTFGGSRVRTGNTGSTTLKTGNTGGTTVKTGNTGGPRVTTGNAGRLAVSAPTTNGNRQLAATSEQLIRGAGGAEAVEQGIKALNAANGNVARAKATSKLPNNTFTNIYAMGGPVAAKRLVEQRRRRRTVGGRRVGLRVASKKKRVAQKPRKQYIKLTPYQFKRLTDHIKKNNLRKVLIKEITH